MPPAFSDCSLYLCPTTPGSVADEVLLDYLLDTGVIGKAIEAGYSYLTGEHYLELINYMGCSPSIAFEPGPGDGDGDGDGDDNGRFCHVNIHRFDAPRLIFCHSQPKKPQCPSCKRPLSSWTAQSAGDAETITCDNCGAVSATEQYNWRKSAGFARNFIEITDIFPREAMPQPALLDGLEAGTGRIWHYFYACR